MEKHIELLRQVIRQYEFAVKDYLLPKEHEVVEDAFTILVREFAKIK